jgi:hypothetical protein
MVKIIRLIMADLLRKDPFFGFKVPSLPPLDGNRNYEIHEDNVSENNSYDRGSYSDYHYFGDSSDSDEDDAYGDEVDAGGAHEGDVHCFLEYPIRQGWASPDSPYAWCESVDLKEATRRAQSWLYFGLLQEFLGSKTMDIKGFLILNKNTTSRSSNLSFTKRSALKPEQELSHFIDTENISYAVRSRSCDLEEHFKAILRRFRNFPFNRFSSRILRRNEYDRIIYFCGIAIGMYRSLRIRQCYLIQSLTPLLY